MISDRTVNVREAGAIGDGRADDFAALQRALDQGGTVYIPDGDYRVPHTLKVPSHTRVLADAQARVFHCGSTVKKRGDFLLSNADPENGNEDIAIEGGVWDGNFDGVNNDKAPDLFDKTAWSGAALNFTGVKGLRLSNLRVVNSVVYFVRLGRIEDFVIEHITFGARRHAYNQDGLHFSGGCRRGVVRDIRAFDGETNDDMIALNADDCVERLENLDLTRDAIEDIVFDGIYAEDCYTAVRMLSVDAPIRNIVMKNIECGCRVHALNMDAARHCRTPLFTDAEKPMGCGAIENVSIEHMHVYSTVERGAAPLIVAETRCHNFEIKDFARDLKKDRCPTALTLRAGYLTQTAVTLGHGDAERQFVFEDLRDSVTVCSPFDRLRIESAK